MNLLVFLCLLPACVVGVYGIQCYVCNSITHPDCEDDYEKYLRNCPVKSFGGRKAVPPIGCRKYRQTADQETSLVRECAYLGENVEGKSSKETELAENRKLVVTHLKTPSIHLHIKEIDVATAYMSVPYGVYMREQGSTGVSRVMTQCSDKPGCNTAATTGLITLLMMPLLLLRI